MNLKIIIASTRPGRRGIHVADWFIDFAQKHSAFNIETLDLEKINLPFLDEPKHPRMQQYVQAHTKEWSKKIDEADAFVFVMPEYNYSMPPALSNAIDFLYKEWNYKPVGLVSYGGISGGLRAAQMSKLQITAVKMMPLAEGVTIPFFEKHIDENNRFVSFPELDKSAEVLLNELAKWAQALKPMREQK